MTTSDPNLPFDPLDECLKTARWPEPTGLEKNRLEARWESLALKRLQSRRLLMRWALAASLLLALGLSIGGWLLMGPRQQEPMPPDPNGNLPQIADRPSISPEELLVRTPTRYEELAFVLAVSHRQRVKGNPQARPLIEALETLLKHPEANLAELCKPLKVHTADYENLILSRLAFWNRAEQITAIHVLKEIGSPKAISVLDQLSRDPELAKHAWPVALHLAPVNMLGEWAKSGTLTQQKDAMQKLLTLRDDPKSLGMLLHLVALPGSRKLAVSVIASDANPPVEQLFACLKRGTKEERHAAGLVLGQLKNPKITKELLAMARKQSFPPEVMLGLVNSSDRDALRFLRQANQYPEARTAVQLACLEWELISYASQFPHPLEIH